MRGRRIRRVMCTMVVVVGAIAATWVYANDSPESDQPKSVAVRLYLTEGQIPTDDPMDLAWDSVPSSEFNVVPQVHWQDRIQEVTVSSVTVRGMSNGENFAVLLEYQDPTEDQADAAGMEFMVGDKKAHFAHGQEMAQVQGGPVNIWYWKKENGKALDMSAKGFGTLRTQDQQNVSATGVWKDGTWRIVFSRSLQTGDEHDVQFTPGEWTNVSFAIWDGEIVDGAIKERGSQKAVSSWWYFRAEPQPDNSLYGYVVLGLVLAVGFEFVLIKKLRKGRTV